MEGGYQILNLGRWNLTSTSTKIKGAYGFIENNTEHKTVLLEDLMLEGKRYDAIFTTFAKAADNYVGNFVLNDMIYTIIVRPNDNINIRKLEPVSDTDLNNIVSDEWNASTDYSAGSYVLRSNKLYVSLLPSNGKDPMTRPEYWEPKKLSELAGHDGWVEIARTSGTDSVSFTGEYKELMIYVIELPGTSYRRSSIVIPFQLLLTTNRSFYTGSVSVAVSKTSAASASNVDTVIILAR